MYHVFLSQSCCTADLFDVWSCYWQMLHEARTHAETTSQEPASVRYFSVCVELGAVHVSSYIVFFFLALSRNSMNSCFTVAAGRGNWVTWAILVLFAFALFKQLLGFACTVATWPKHFTCSNLRMMTMSAFLSSPCFSCVAWLWQATTPRELGYNDFFEEYHGMFKELVLLSLFPIDTCGSWPCLYHLFIQ